MTKTPQETTIEWEGRSIRLSYQPHYFQEMAHLEIRAADGEPLPMTETGYRSHFFATDEASGMDEVAALVRDWLDEEAQSKRWQDYFARSRQLELF
ncbi:hypothetical protein B7H23_03250 [Notoacmeibacter marinus]|uniref:Uncharacterized protein n=1 Tax=Notoacmeibacter marinus TaxID=1876515 RepID=A0A231V197_9HYPH|nr:hypothetical protein [Notoacmeibacter marinus]OXT01968.1 hypothetical protein B7H23_03250 [Notoacmeibacter marinus]